MHLLSTFKIGTGPVTTRSSQSIWLEVVITITFERHWLDQLSILFITSGLLQLKKSTWQIKVQKLKKKMLIQYLNS